MACNLIGDDIFLWAVIEETLKFIAIFSLVYLVGLRISAILFIGIGFGFIEALPEVGLVEYVNREKALAVFRERHEDDQLILQALDELNENPLGANLNIKAKETSQYEGIAKFLDSQNALASGDGNAIIDRVNYYQNKVAIDHLNSIIDSIETLSLALVFLFIFISIAMTFNTVRLTVFTARDEISVMKLVGAENKYVRGPFVVEGALSGVISAFIALILFYPLTLWLGPSTETFFGGISIFDYYLNNFGHIFLIMLVAGIVLGGGSSYLAVRRYLKI